MTQASRPIPVVWEDEPPPLVRWRAWALVDRPLAAVGVLGSLALVWIGVEAVTDKAHLATLATASLVVALWRFFVPVMYELNADGVNQWVLGRSRRIPWGQVRRYILSASGVLLMPSSDGAPIDVLRGEFVPWKNYRQEVLAQIRYYLDPLVEDAR